MGSQGAVCAEGACPREALEGHGGRTLQVGPRRARACACARAGASAGSGCGDGPACQAEWRSGRVGPREESGHAEPGRVREEGVDWPCGKRERERERWRRTGLGSGVGRGGGPGGLTVLGLVLGYLSYFFSFFYFYSKQSFEFKTKFEFKPHSIN